MVPVSAAGSEALIAAARQLVLLPLDDQLGPRKGVVIADMVNIKVCADQQIDIVRLQDAVSDADVTAGLDSYREEQGSSAVMRGLAKTKRAAKLRR